MPRGKKLVRLSEGSRQNARLAYKDMGKEMYKAYAGPCLIPYVPDDGFVETNSLSDCYVIGAQFLKLIANSSREVCTWNMNAHQIGKNAIYSSWDVTERSPVPNFEPFEPDQKPISSYLCKSKFACQPHRSKVFKAIDGVRTFTPTDPEHQFRLGLRAIAGALANTEGVLTYSDTLLNASKNCVESSLEKIEMQLQENQATADTLRAELGEWWRIYKTAGERQIISHHMSARARIRVAISTVTQQENRPIATCTLLPRAINEPGETICDIILTSRQPKSDVLRVPYQQDQYLEDQALKIKALLEGDPATGLTGLVRALSMTPTTFFFVSPDDYYNDEIISDAGRAKIEQDIASIANDRFPR